ncbi:MAG: nitrogen fixation protein NifH [Spirochaetes bacterium]|nr:nitrogen fixation protein NifH [Spirochaetota bacterium]
MESWKKILTADPTDWLLEEENPSVRYLTLTGLLDESEKNAAVKKAKKQIMAAGIVPRILAKQRNNGSWEDAGQFYREKYRGTVWQLIILAEAMADGHDARVRNACEYLLAHSQDKRSGGFSVDASADGGGRHSYIIPCLAGNMLFSLIRLGYLNDERIKRGIDWVIHYQTFDDGVKKAPRGWPYDQLTGCFGHHSCHMGVVKVLKAFSEIPEKKRSLGVTRVIESAVEFMLTHHIYKKSHALDEVSKPGWLKFGFPLMYQTDVLEIMLLMAKLNITDDRMKDALSLVISRQDSRGRWNLQQSFNGRFQVNCEVKGKPSKWLTLNACRVLKKYAGTMAKM